MPMEDGRGRPSSISTDQVLTWSCGCADLDLRCMQRLLILVGMNCNPASHLHVLDRGRRIALDELGFAIELHRPGRPVAGLHRERMVGDCSDRSQNVLHAAMSEGQRAQQQSANQDPSYHQRPLFHVYLLEVIHRDFGA